MTQCGDLDALGAGGNKHAVNVFYGRCGSFAALGKERGNKKRGREGR